MNSKALATLGVIVAFLAGWLLISLSAASTVEVEDQSEGGVPQAMNTSVISPDSNPNGNVRTSVQVLEDEVSTSVEVLP